MQNLQLETWQALVIGLLIGFIIGYLLLRFTKGSVKKQVKTETELKKAKAELDKQKQHLEKHFSESADLLKTIGQDYQKLYTHLATSSTELLPEFSSKELFSQQLIAKTEEIEKNDVTVDEIKDGKSTPEEIKAEK